LRRRVTLIELTFCLFGLIGAVAGAKFAIAHDLGPGYTALMIWSFGQSLAFFGTLAALLVYDYFDSWRTGRPHWPACSHCGATKLSFDRAREQSIATCPCGARYVRHGHEYREVLPGGASRPYLRWRPFRRWVDVRTADTTPDLAPYRGSDPPR